MSPYRRAAHEAGTQWRRYRRALWREVRARLSERRVMGELGAADVCTGQARGPVVSLTSYPPRIGRVHLTVRSILMQSFKPSKIELVLALEEFPQRELPETLSELLPRGLVVRWTERNIRSFKKLVPLLDDLDQCAIVTADDDVVYPTDWLASLWMAHRSSPLTIWGTRGREILVREGVVRPYSEWPFSTRSTPSALTLLTGMGGILYPPRSLPGSTGDMSLAMALCPDADDIWFKACAMSIGTEVRQIGDVAADFPTRWSGQRRSLTSTNLHNGKNDDQFRQTFEHFGLLSRLTP